MIGGHEIQYYFFPALFLIIPFVVPLLSIFLEIEKTIRNRFLVFAYLFPFIPILAFFINSSLISSKSVEDEMSESELRFLIIVYIWAALTPAQIAICAIELGAITGSNTISDFGYIIVFLIFSIPISIVCFIIGLLLLMKRRKS